MTQATGEQLRENSACHRFRQLQSMKRGLQDKKASPCTEIKMENLELRKQQQQRIWTVKTINKQIRTRKKQNKALK